ncbi:MAG: lysophospholipid acyltransferase family protein [Desulforegulaceae bacterium]|nr:1-acyl-sn-glycerol-3-phosphate acyltransferase [Desulfobacteraceae bacterium]MDY0360294.1 lysophospholipid acyltransferase family protein [Desulforegulaceae bacterium]
MIFTDISLKFKEYRSPLLKLLYYLYQPYKWLFFVPFLIIMNFAIFIFIPFTAFFCPKYLDLLAVIWSRLSLFATPVFTEIKGKENIERDKSYIIVANHSSQYDIFVLYGWLGIPFKWVMKEELRKVPVIGYFCEVAGHIFIDRSKPDEAIKRINNAKENLIKENKSILFFPEGTRSLDGRVKNFKKGAFQLALEMKIPVLPVTIKGTHSILPSKTTDLLPGRAELIIHKPINVEDLDKNSINGLIYKTKSIIESSL